MERSNKGRTNVHFRQTPKEFRSQSQAQSFGHIKRNIPFRIFSYTRGKIKTAFTMVKGSLQNFSLKLPKNAKKMK